MLTILPKKSIGTVIYLIFVLIYRIENARHRDQTWLVKI